MVGGVKKCFVGLFRRCHGLNQEYAIHALMLICRVPQTKDTCFLVGAQ